MHFKREQIIDGVRFVAVPEQWLESTIKYLSQCPVVEVADILNEAFRFTDAYPELSK